MNDEKVIGDPRMEYFIDIMVRLQERGHDIAATPITIQSVHNVLAVADEIMAEDLFDSWSGSSDGPDDYSFETFRVLNKEAVPAGALERIEAIVEANEIVYFHEFLHDTANDDAATWDEYMNRGNARSELGRFDEALQDYSVAESLADQPGHLKMIAGNKASLLRKMGGPDNDDGKE